MAKKAASKQLPANAASSSDSYRRMLAQLTELETAIDELLATLKSSPVSLRARLTGSAKEPKCSA